MRFRIPLIFIFVLTFVASAQTQQNAYDIIIKGGTVYDGSGRPPRRADVGIKGDRIAAVGNLKSAQRHDGRGCQRSRGSAGLHQHALAL